jgi:RNA polymerase sigma factor (sigma-70 family)
MDLLFNAILQRISQNLMNLARKFRGYCLFVDKDDLYQEMSLHLWDRYKKGELAGKTNAYLIQSCKFHIMNYLRKKKDNVLLTSIDEIVSESGETLKDNLPDTERKPILEDINDDIAIESITKNASLKEKKIIDLLYKGFTTREIGDRLGISHVMVVKHKKIIAQRMKLKK